MMHWKVRHFIYWWKQRLRNPVKGLLVELRIIVLAFRSTRGLNLGDTVVHNGKRYVLNQGVCNPRWDMLEWVPKDQRQHGDREYLKFIHQDDFRKEWSLGNLRHDLRFTYRFYSGYWRDIWEGHACRDIIHMTIALWSRLRVDTAD